jgi:hypothetical protein
MRGHEGKVLSFGPFELSIGSRRLTNGAKVVPLGGRAMDLLIVLVEHANKVVGRRTLIERVWPKRGAEQVSLRVHISALRKALENSDPGRRYNCERAWPGVQPRRTGNAAFIAGVRGYQASRASPTACALDADARPK